MSQVIENASPERASANEEIVHNNLDTQATIIRDLDVSQMTKDELQDTIKSL